jgi:hypothetical protein
MTADRQDGYQQDVNRPPQTYLHKVVAVPKQDYEAEDSPAEGTGIEDTLDDEIFTEEDPIEQTRPDGAPVTETSPEDSLADDVVAEDALTQDALTEDPITEDPIAEDPLGAGGPAEDALTEDSLTADDRTASPVVRASEMDSVPEARRPEPADGQLLGASAADLMARWRQAAADFVDDPSASAASAAAVATDAVARLQAAIREREQQLNGNGQPDTEALRQAMLSYRRILDTLLS